VQNGVLRVNGTPVLDLKQNLQAAQFKARSSAAQSIARNLITAAESYRAQGTNQSIKQAIDCDAIPEMPAPSNYSQFVSTCRIAQDDNGTYIILESSDREVILFDGSQMRTANSISEAQAYMPAGVDLSNRITISSGVASSNPEKLEIVTPGQDPKVFGIQRLYDLADKNCDQIGDPGKTKTCQVTVDASRSYAWGSAWCATKASATSNLLNNTSFQYFVDGKSVSSDQFWTGETPTCLRRRLVVKNFEAGSQHEFKLVIQVTRDVSDGSSVYKAGRYELQLDVTAQ
jgi:type IV pilus assembly protein PilA